MSRLQIKILAVVVDLADFLWIHITVFLDVSLKSVITP
jgi:hypothetical protein